MEEEFLYESVPSAIWRAHFLFISFPNLTKTERNEQKVCTFFKKPLILEII